MFSTSENSYIRKLKFNGLILSSLENRRVDPHVYILGIFKCDSWDSVNYLFFGQFSIFSNRPLQPPSLSEGLLARFQVEK